SAPNVFCRIKTSVNIRHFGFGALLATSRCETSIPHAKARSSPRNTSETFAVFVALRETFPRFATRTN
ncbi:MAG TPA: hypothetical protein P5121_40410, partial [Caldilineaceae bacterium]|nr:hypothetical protein [Caldilineaceae bacterium]